MPNQNNSRKSITQKRRNTANTWPEIPWRKSVKKTSMPKPVKSRKCIKCYSSSSPRPAKSPSNSFRCTCQKICSWLRGPKIILEIRKKATFLYLINNPINYKFFKDFTNHGKKTNRAIVFSYRPFTNILKYRQHPNNLENKTPADTYWRVQLVCKKAQAHSALEPLMEYNQHHTHLTNQGLLSPF